MNKNQRIIIIIVFLFTIIISVCLTTMVQISIGNKRLVSVSEWENLVELKHKYSRIEDVEKYIKSNYYKDTSDIDFTQSQIDGLFSKLDPYSSFLDEQMYRDLLESSAGSFGGIGIQISTDELGYTKIETPMPDTPAEKVGLKSGDRIFEVDGNNIVGKNLYEVVKLLKGEADTNVKLKLIRESKELEFELTREIISVAAVDSRMLKTNDNIGYIQIRSFSEKVFDEFKEHYEKLVNDGIVALVIDLRNNPGGSLQQCEVLADYILGEQVVVSTKDGKGKVEEYKSDTNKLEIPYVILVNKGSASASEILAGAIKDTKSAKLIGETTFGKGLVQSVVPWGKDTAIKLTIAQYFTPNGNYIHDTGIEPDIKVELSKDYKKDDESSDNQLQTGIEELKKLLK